MKCQECIHNEMCYLTHTDDSPACCNFKNAADVVEASEYKRLCNKLSREERRVRKLKKRIEELEKGAQE